MKYSHFTLALRYKAPGFNTVLISKMKELLNPIDNCLNLNALLHEIDSGRLIDWISE